MQGSVITVSPSSNASWHTAQSTSAPAQGEASDVEVESVAAADEDDDDWGDFARRFARLSAVTVVVGRLSNKPFFTGLEGGGPGYVYT